MRSVSSRLNTSTARSPRAVFSMTLGIVYWLITPSPGRPRSAAATGVTAATSVRISSTKP